MNAEAATGRRGAAEWLVLVGRFAALVYVNVLVWLSVWVLIPTLFMGWQPMAIDSGSMGPSIHAGDVVLVSDFTGEPLRTGRVVTFRDPADPDRLVTHRVSAVNDEGTYQTKGDANVDADSTPLTPQQIHGVGRLVVPRVGIPVVWLAQGNYAALGAWALSVVLALILLAPPRRAADPSAAPPADHPVPASVAPPVVSPPLPFLPSLPVPPGVAAPALFPLVPAVRYRLRLPEPPPALELPAPPRWSVSLVPPPPGTRPMGPIPPPPRPAAVRRGSALTSRDVPGWTGRLHGIAIVLAVVCGLGVLTAASAPPAAAAFSSTHHRTVANTGNSFTSDQLATPTNPSITAPLAACRLTVGWDPSPSGWRDGYRIYRSVDGGAYSLLATTAHNAIGYIDETANNASRTYRYKIVAHKASAWESPATVPVSASPSLAACAA